MLLFLNPKVVNLVGKGRGIVASKSFLRGDFVIEYHGDLIGDDAAKTREKRYGATPEVGCYMYYFRFNNKCYWFVVFVGIPFDKAPLLVVAKCTL